MWKAKIGIGIGSGNMDYLKKTLQTIKQIGFDAFFTGWDRNLFSIKELKEYSDEIGIVYQSVHAPFINIRHLWFKSEKTEFALQEQIQCLEDCADAGVPIMICHCFIGFEDHTLTDSGIKNFGILIDYAEKLGVKLAFENTEGEEYLAAIMKTFGNRKCVGFCWDTGHEMCYNHSQDLLSLYGDKLIATHLNDNLGIKDYNGEITWLDDMHLWPFDGIADWQDITARMVEHGYDDILTFELDLSKKTDDVQYFTEVYKRACKVAALKIKAQENK